MNQEVALKCEKCGAVWQGTAPEPRVVNTPDVCMVVAVPGTNKCPNIDCGAEYLMTIAKANILYGFVHIAEKRTPSGIVIPNGSQPKTPFWLGARRRG